jgi:hypothetical protein
MQISEISTKETLAILDKRSGKKAWAVHGKSKLTETEKGEKGEEQSQDHANHFFGIMGIVHKECPGSPNS